MDLIFPDQYRYKWAAFVNRAMRKLLIAQRLINSQEGLVFLQLVWFGLV
jgi:hypothetical protein